jgi:hypothetical protein
MAAVSLACSPPSTNENDTWKPAPLSYFPTPVPASVLKGTTAPSGASTGLPEHATLVV